MPLKGKSLSHLEKGIPFFLPSDPAHSFNAKTLISPPPTLYDMFQEMVGAGDAWTPTGIVPPVRLFSSICFQQVSEVRASEG